VPPEPGHLAARVRARVADRELDRAVEIDLAAEVRHPVHVSVRAHARQPRVDAAREQPTRLVEDALLDHRPRASLDAFDEPRTRRGGPDLRRRYRITSAPPR